MATSQKLKDDFLTCHICMEVYQKPVTLDCQHTYCKGCLTKYFKTQTEAVKTKSIPCPSCRRHIPVPHPDRPVEEWAPQFKTGLVIQGLMDSLVHGNTDTDICSVCKKEGKTTRATHWCPECEVSLCDECLRQHNRMPGLSHHGVSDLTAGETPQEQMRKKKFVCKKHDEKIKLFCKDCKKTLCTVCCSVGHRLCKDVVEIQEMLPEIRTELRGQQKRITDRIEAKTEQINKQKIKIEDFAAKTNKIRAEITQSFRAAADLLRKKEQQLLDKVDDIMEQQTGEMKANIKCDEIARQTYQQQSQFIQQAMKFEDEAQLYEMYLSSGSGAVAGETETDSEDMTDIVDISFTHNMKKLREDIDTMDVTVVCVCDDVIDLTAPPVLQEVVDMTFDGRSSSLRDVVVLNNNGVKSIVVNDYDMRILKTVYMENGKKCTSKLDVPGHLWVLAVITQTKLIASFNDTKLLLIVAVNPDLMRLSTITTNRVYWSLAVLDQSTLVAGSELPSSVDVLDMTGHVLRSFTTLPSIQKSISRPRYLHVTNNGNILVSDCGLTSVICLTSKGEVVFHYSPTGNRKLIYPYGITSRTTGDILFADWDTHKVIHLTQSGEFVKDILTSQDGLKNPFGLCFDGDTLYVTTSSNGVYIFKFSRN